MKTDWLNIEPERDTRTSADIQAEIDQAFFDKYGFSRMTDIMRLDGWLRSDRSSSTVPKPK